MSFVVGEVISYRNMCDAEGTQLQQGMNFRLRSGRTVILMSRRPNAPYSDSISDDGSTIKYEGHDVPKNLTETPKLVDQTSTLPSGKLTQNGFFFKAAKKHSIDGEDPESVRVYEKIIPGSWVFNGTFYLVDAHKEFNGTRFVFKFILNRIDDDLNKINQLDKSHTRYIPAEIKREVLKRDNGQCVMCGRTDNLHFDHDLPYSLGGSSITSENIQLLCAFHNLSKSNKIQ